MSTSVSSQAGRASARRAWLVCLGCGLALFTVMGLGVNAFTVYQPYLLELEHFTNAQGSWITTARSLFGMLSMATADALCRRYGLRRVIVSGLGCFVFSYFLFGAAHSFLSYCAAAVFSGLAYGYGGMVPLTLVISRWFQDRRGFALGLMAAGTGISTILAPPLLTAAIQNAGLRFAFWAEGLFGLALTLLVLLLIRDRPEDVGLAPYTTGATSVKAAPRESSQIRLPPALWWAAVAAAFFTGGPCGPGFSHLSVLYTAEGYPSGTVALLISYFGIILMISKVLYGTLSDALGSRAANYVTYGAGILGLCLCCLASIPSVPLAAAACTFTALGMPLSSVSLSVWAGDFSRGADYDRLVKWLSTSYMLGALVTGPVPGILADRFGSYVPAYALFAGCCCAPWFSFRGCTSSWGWGSAPQNPDFSSGPGGPLFYGFRAISHRTMAAAAAAFRDSHRSRMGILMVWTLRESSSGETPLPSLPMTTAARTRHACSRETVSSRRAVANRGMPERSSRAHSPPASVSYTGRRKQAPMDARTTLGLYGSAQFPTRIRPSAPRASAVRQMVPTLPGS